MLESSLLTAITVFAEIANNETDLKSVISEFIKALFPFEKTIALDSTEGVVLLKKHFDFDIPEAVVRTCLNGLHNKGFVERAAGKYNLRDKSYSASLFEDAFTKASSEQATIEGSLIRYSESLIVRELAAQDRQNLLRSFRSFLLGDQVHDDHFVIINSFIIQESNSPLFVGTLNRIKEGLILVSGLRHTSDLASLERWNEEIVIYLDTEILFHHAGLNGELFQRTFDDFFSFVKEINGEAMKKTGKKAIQLQYFQDTKVEVDGFFKAAITIVRREENASPENLAMASLCKDCTSASDVLRKRAKFDLGLKTAGISVKEDGDYYSRPEFNVEDRQLLEKYGDRHQEEKIHEVLKMFTKINVLRRGLNGVSFEGCRHIILTGKALARQLSQDLEVKTERRDIPFATDLDFVTNRLWFKLNKGLGKSARLPDSLGIVAKAQIAMSSLLNKSVTKKYAELRTDVSSGKLSEAEAQTYYNNLRSNSRKPEEITPQTLRESMDFIFMDEVDVYLRTQSDLKERVKRGELALSELRKRDFREYDLKRRAKKSVTKILSCTILLASIILSLCFFGLIGYGIARLKSDADSPLSLIGLALSLLGGLFTVVRYYPKLYTRFIRRVRRWYVGRLEALRLKQIHT